ncbi:MAG: helix-turn-helix domain-containing protein [Ignavibacteria bacterium]|nr:helix-turn-helix domain-containing protein [Ignavibacteria bacterium]
MHSEKNHIKFCGVKAAAEFLGVSVQTLRYWIQKKSISYYKPNGKILLFDISELEAFVRKKKVLSNDEFLEKEGIETAAVEYLNSNNKVNANTESRGGNK